MPKKIAPDPPTQVRNLDDPAAPIRLVSLPPSQAVLWCYASDMGVPEAYLSRTFRSKLIFANGEYVCGPYAAKEVDDADD